MPPYSADTFTAGEVPTTAKWNKLWNNDANFNQRIVEAAPVGGVEAYAGSVAPAGWLLANGSAVSRTTYAALFAIIGTAYGPGDGATTFNLPNLKGRMPVGRDAAQVEFDVIGETGGTKAETLTLAQIPNASGNMAWHGGESGTPIAGVSGVFYFAEVIGQYKSNGAAIGGANSGRFNTYFSLGGGGGSHNNLQPYQVMNYIIKT